MPLDAPTACDDSKQNWYHSLACLRTNLEILKAHWPDLTESSLQSDGAGNYSCTAFMTSLPRVGEVTRVKITDHAVTEVGDGKNLVDTDFQQVTMSLNQRKDGGADIETAQQIFDNLNANPTLGTKNAAIDTSARAEGMPPKPYAGIDGIYWRVFEYDATGACTGVRLHQFYGLGVGRVVSIGALRELWKEGGQLDAGAIEATRLLPSAGEQATSSKRKLSEHHAADVKAAKVAARKAREVKKMVGHLDSIAAERRREKERTTLGCAHATAGCRRRFLSKEGASKHAVCCWWGASAQQRHSVAAARVHVRVLRRSQVMPPPCCRHRLATAIAKAAPVMRVVLKVRRPLQGPTYGLARFSVLPQGVGVASIAEVRVAGGDATPDGSVCAALAIKAGGIVRLTLCVNRPPLAPLLKGWAIKPPVVRTRYTNEQKALLLECFNNPQRPNERNAHELFVLRFKEREGHPFARNLVMAAAKIKAWYSSEKQRRLKAVTVRFVAAEAQDEEDAGTADAPGPVAAAAVGSTTSQGGGRGRGDGRYGRGSGGRRGRARGAAAGAATAPRVNAAEMRAEMRRLGYAAEERAAKKRAEVVAALEMARAHPREPSADAESEGEERDEGEESSEESGEEISEELGEDVYAVHDIVAKRRRGRPQVTEYLIHWKGYSKAHNTWEPGDHIPAALIADFNESRLGLEEETENDDSEGEVSEDEEVAPAPPPAKGKRPAAPPRAPPPAKKRASAATGSSSAAGSRPAKRAPPLPAADSSDDEAAVKRKKAAPPKPKPKPNPNPNPKPKPKTNV